MIDKSALKTMSHFGFDRVHDLENGSSQDIPWGVGDWATLVCGGVFFGSFAAVMVSVAAAMWRS